MIRVLLVDDSSTARRLFARALGLAEEIVVVGEAEDPYVARDRILELQPDVVVLDVEMPRMDGIEFLRRLMQHMPIPVVICSSSAVAGGETALRALRAGAVEVIGKPNENYSAEQLGRDLIAAVRAAAAAGARSQGFAASPRDAGDADPARTAPAVAISSAPRKPRAVLARGAAPDHVDLIAIGASTGGTIAVESITRALPAEMPPVVIVQHMPPYITAAFALRLSQTAKMKVEEARDGVLLQAGVALVAPGGSHIMIERASAALRARLRKGPRVNGHIPSVDVLFRSVADNVGAAAVGVLLTGMGRDGADGLLAMRSRRARTLAQDEASSVVWGMPKAAIDLDAADEVIPLSLFASRLVRIANGTCTR